MISLLYNSHTVVPAHLAELEALGLVEPDEQILVALDGVLLDSAGHRLSGPTLHDYALITSLRVVLWARDYGRHLCYAFPLAELSALDGMGVDPLHAAIQMSFAALDGEAAEEQFTFTLLPLADLQAALTLLRAAAETARALHAQGVAAREAAPAVFAALSEQIYGHADGPRPEATPYRWPGAEAHPDGSGRMSAPVLPPPAFQQDPANLPPGQIYAAGRLARSAWDTLRRSLKDAELPFELNGSSLRDLTETVRAINDLVNTVATNPAAQQMAMTFLNRANSRGTAPAGQQAAPEEFSTPAAPAWEPPAAAPASNSYHEIPLRRRAAPAATASPLTPADARPAPVIPVVGVSPRGEPAPNHREIPLRRRVAAPGPAAKIAPQPRPIAMSGSGDADIDEERR